MIRKLIYSLGIIALMGALLTPKVEAGLLQLRLTDNLGNTVTIADQGGGDSNPANGAVTFIGGLGGLSTWTVNVTTGISDPIFPATSGYAKMDLNSVNVSTSGAGWLSIELTYTGFPAFPQDGILIGNIGGTTNGTVDAWGYKTLGETPFDYNNPLAYIEFNQFTPIAFSGTETDAHGPINGLYTMTQKVLITHSGAGSTSFDYELVNTVPVPSGIILLGMGAPLLGAGFWMRRRRVAVA